MTPQTPTFIVSWLLQLKLYPWLTTQDNIRFILILIESFPDQQARWPVKSTHFGDFSSTDYQMVIRSTSSHIRLLLLLLPLSRSITADGSERGCSIYTWWLRENWPGWWRHFDCQLIQFVRLDPLLEYNISISVTWWWRRRNHYVSRGGWLYWWYYGCWCTCCGKRCRFVAWRFLHLTYWIDWLIGHLGCDMLLRWWTNTLIYQLTRCGLMSSRLIYFVDFIELIQAICWWRHILSPIMILLFALSFLFLR